MTADEDLPRLALFDIRVLNISPEDFPPLATQLYVLSQLFYPFLHHTLLLLAHSF